MGRCFAQIGVDLGDRLLLLGRERERKRAPVAVEELPRLAECRRARLLGKRLATADEAELEQEELLEAEAGAGGLGVFGAFGAVNGGDRVGPERQALASAELCGKRVRHAARERERGLDQRADAVGGQSLGRGILGDEAERVHAGAAELVTRHLEALQVARPVEEELGAGCELRQVRLVEPHDLLLDAGRVDDDALDDLEIPPPRRPDADARELAAHRRLLPESEVAEARRLVPVQVGARDVLHEIADGLDSQARPGARRSSGPRPTGTPRVAPRRPPSSASARLGPCQQSRPAQGACSRRGPGPHEDRPRSGRQRLPAGSVTPTPRNLISSVRG